MAEFQEVMEQFDRMCWHYRRKYECPGTCPMKGGSILQCQKITFKEPKETEETIMSWAAEHPIVYPTWIDVMKMYGVTDETGYCYLDSAYKPIPADIAEKLGIEPKEG